MQYCPKCKTEYEDHAEVCVDCDLALVPNLEDHTFMKELVQVKVADAQRMVEYLDYSGITKIEKEAKGDSYLLKVPQESYEDAVMYLGVYIRENMEETDTEDFYMDEYITEETDGDTKVSDMKSTVWTFGGVGAGVLVLTALNWFDIVSLKGFNKPMLTVVFGLLGLGFLIIAYRTNSGIGAAKETEDAKEARITAVVNGYKEKRPLDGFYKKHRIRQEGLDEGALYFQVFDVLKKDVKKLFPDENDTIINTAVERLYDMLGQED